MRDGQPKTEAEVNTVVAATLMSHQKTDFLLELRLAAKDKAELLRYVMSDDFEKKLERAIEAQDVANAALRYLR